MNGPPPPTARLAGRLIASSAPGGDSVARVSTGWASSTLRLLVAGDEVSSSAGGGAPAPQPDGRGPLAETLLPLLIAGGLSGVAGSLLGWVAGACLFLGAAGMLAVLAGRAAAARRAARQARVEADAAQAMERQALEESRAKSRFLAEMSHELRTPLNAVMGFSEIMADEMLGAHGVPAYRGYARDIHSAGRHLLALADDILDLARIETGHRSLLETPVALDALAGDCVRMMRPDADARGLRLAVEAAPIRLWGDERALRQMALNLIANAVKFTGTGGSIRVLAGRGADGAPFLAVEDSGRGEGEEPPLPLPARYRESRLDLATGRGAGLGLAIVQGLAALHDGDLAIIRLPTGGTLARLTFPPARALD